MTLPMCAGGRSTRTAWSATCGGADCPRATLPELHRVVDGGGRVVAAQREQRGSFGRRRTIWHLNPPVSSSPKDRESPHITSRSYGTLPITQTTGGLSASISDRMHVQPAPVRRVPISRPAAIVVSAVAPGHRG